MATKKKKVKKYYYGRIKAKNMSDLSREVAQYPEIEVINIQTTGILGLFSDYKYIAFYKRIADADELN